VAQGAAVFEALECQACHAGEAGTDGEAYDVGTGGTFDTPTINWLWQSAPYFHDGRATTLDEVFILPGTHQLVGNIPIEDIEALITYLNTRP
jgi:cytochrome c peroxidase